MFYTAYEGLSAGIMSANPPYGYTYTSAAPPLFDSPFTVAATGFDAGQRFPLQKVAYGASRTHPNATVDWSQFEPLVGIPGVDPNDVTPYAEHWMASVERQLGTASLLTVSYVGASSHHLLVLEEANPADPALCLSLGQPAGRSTSKAPALSSVPLLAASSCSAQSPMRAITHWRRQSIIAPMAWRCWPATRSRNPSISLLGCRSRLIP